MTLSSALNTATSSLQSTQTQTAVVSRNIANANVQGATRKYVNVATGAEGRIEVRSISQSQNTSLFRNVLNGTADVGRSSVIAGALDRMNEVIGDTDGKGSPAARLAAFETALQTYRSSPANNQQGSAAVTAANNLAGSLNAVSATIDEIRRDADNELALAAEDMNALLSRVEELNRRITTGTVGNLDVTDEIDQRDRAIQNLSQYVGISVLTRANNDVVIQTDSGVTMFDKSARKVEFEKSYPLRPDGTGNAFRIDGTVVTGGNTYMPIASGKVAGLIELRDKVMVDFQAQVDTVARQMIQAFQETGSGLPTKQGLFQDGDVSVAAMDTEAGVAGRITVAAAALKDPTLLRDGGINDDDGNASTTSQYRSNPETNAPGYTGRLEAFTDALGAGRNFSAPGLTMSGSIAAFAQGSMSWLQGTRAAAHSANDYQQTLLDKTQTTLTNETGIDLNAELTRLLDLQRSFQASSKIISTVDQMLAALLQSV